MALRRRRFCPASASTCRGDSSWASSAPAGAANRRSSGPSTASGSRRRGLLCWTDRDICDVDVLCLRRRVGMLFQLPAIFEGTVADNVKYGPKLQGKKLSDSEVLKLLSQADLEPSLASRNASELSVGQAQRVALARTLANEPELKKARGMTIVIVSHSVKQIQRIADLACLLVDGQIVEVLEPGRLSEADHPMARRFLELS
ncbi:Protein STAR1 [Acorus calamus]|uniref:Protein STAR1 n=1 Tax=Acorus calamus TaxID=4465 RepID=A0AAV9CXU3_ACOCL|nr:Protein STAR1 [Acorus calamus]